MDITSIHNPKIKTVTRLKNKKDRDETGLFLIEGYRECLRAKEANWTFTQLFYAPDLFLGENEYDLIDSIQAQKFEVTKEVFAKISYRDRPDGLLAIAKVQNKTVKDLDHYLAKIKDPFLIIAESIEKPGNLGSILRSADATGCHGVIVANRCTDIYNPNVVRSSVGTLFTVPVFELSNQEIMPIMKKYHIDLVAATPHTDELYYDINMKGPIAILVGTEQLGLSVFWISQASHRIKIPMLGKADSLNVSNATTVLMYEVVRQRHSFSR
ncbi:MAG: RNA methyltransferase [Chlamydiales bacterium]|nr:RNA methyltransferase [Chlamydiales bacterium]